ncbi:hypothetical protein ACH5RR_017548 [Cinchona calisaya]|uniref:RIN4 pathogenic type III effector avirulence factor Avr cleavage site domain-containing protein n=1 Tax=Cinchona calisaya TaxID=153742 RepID=A0ABD2ZJN5_9GENT
MAQRSHVPEFGNWDGDNVPYTAYFENARKEKINGVRMNPNDPEENPEAFMFAGTMKGNYNDVCESNKPTNSSKKYHNIGHRRNTSDQQKSVGLKSFASESSSDKSNYDNSHHRKRSERKKSMTSDNSSSFFTMSPVRNRARGGGSNASDDLSSKSASVPKFGAWDERDPKSGEGFTVIFNKVKEEKQIAASKFPLVQPQSSNYSEGQKRNSISKVTR